jgi:hypothetical protein
MKGSLLPESLITVEDSKSNQITRLQLHPVDISIATSPQHE